MSLWKNILPYWQLNFFPYKSHKTLYTLINIIISIEMFHTLLNFFLATIIKPGSIDDIRKSKYYKTHSPYYSDYLIFPQREIEMEAKKI